jgi:signal transduction histidine kinase
MLTTEFDSLTQRDIKEYINIINDSSKTLFGMTNNLLHYSRLQLSKFDFEPRQLNLHETIKVLVESLELKTKKKDQLIKSEVSEEYFIHADEEMLNILLENLILNAIKYSNLGGVIKVFAEKLDNSDKINAIKLSISDEGVGISEEDLLKIKSGIMYSTLGTAKESGLGLGLLLAEKFMDIHKSKMEIISKEGEGTTIIVNLPTKAPV